MSHITIAHADGNQTHTVRNIYCIGLNYSEHIAEMGSTQGKDPVVFLKPNTAIVRASGAIQLPTFSSNVHHEIEIVLHIAKDGDDIAEADAWDYIDAYGIGLDLTARDVQSAAKKAGKPWAVAKGFKQSACVSTFTPHTADTELAGQFTLTVNGAQRQAAHTKEMIHPIPKLIAHLSSIFGLRRGDLIYTGTPSGVAPVVAGDNLELTLDVAGTITSAAFSVAR